jgi:hypothetical protein
MIVTKSRSDVISCAALNQIANSIGGRANLIKHLDITIAVRQNAVALGV